MITMKKDVQRKAGKSQLREQQIGAHQHLDELSKRLAQSEEARGQNVSQARWDAAAAQIKPKTIGEKAAVRALEKPRDVEQHVPEAEAIPITEQPQKPGLLSRWVEAGKKLAAAAAIAAAVSPAAVGDAAEVRVSERDHIRVTEDITKEVRGVVKRDGNVYVSKKGKRGKAVADLRPGDTIHVYEPTTIDDEGLRIINESDYYGTWVMGDAKTPVAKLILMRTNKGDVEGVMLQAMKQQNAYITYAIKDGSFDRDTGTLKASWNLAGRVSRLGNIEALGESPDRVSDYVDDIRFKTRMPSTGGAQFRIMDDGSMLYGYRMDTPSGKFTKPQRVLGPWKKTASSSPSRGSGPITPGTRGFTPGYSFPTATAPFTSTSLKDEVDNMLGSELNKQFFKNVDGALGKMLDGLKADRSLANDPQYWLELAVLYGSKGCDYWGDTDVTAEENKQRVDGLACLNKALELDLSIANKPLWGQPFQAWYNGIRDTAVRSGGFTGDTAKLTVTVENDGSLKIGEK